VRPDALCGLLAEPDRLQAFAAVVLGAGTPTEVAQRAGLPPREAVRCVRRLAEGGLLDTGTDGRLTAVAGAFKDAVRESRPEPPGEPLDPDRDRAAVLRVFVRDGRLVTIPVPRAKRRVVLEHIVTVFEPGVRYPERAVDALLRAWYDDHASLRRYLVDENLMQRADGVYWRSGGPVDVG